MDGRIFDVWLASSGLSALAACTLICELGSAENVKQTPAAELVERGLLSDKAAYSLPRSLDKAYKIIEDCEKLSYDILTFGGKKYPECLMRIKNPPIVLYVSGKLPDFDALPAFAIVGSRNASAAGLAKTEQIAFELAAAGAVVVSGMAKGCDAAAHRGALKAGGLTVAVLGCGLDICYPAENRELYWRIPESGALVSEYPPGTKATPYSFPERNRIVSGLSRGVLVAEAAEKSGSLITARLACEQGRTLFTLPAGPTKSTAGNAMLAKSGAVVVSTGAGMLGQSEDPAIVECPEVLKIIPDKPTETGNKTEAEILRALKYGPMASDDIAEAVGASAAEIATALSMLEIKGEIHRIAGNRYIT